MIYASKRLYIHIGLLLLFLIEQQKIKVMLKGFLMGISINFFRLRLVLQWFHCLG